MTEADIYLTGVIALGLLAVALLIVIRVQAGDLDQAGRDLDQTRAAADLAERQYAIMRRLHQRQQVWIRRQREQLTRYRNELDAVTEATRPSPVEEDLETEVRRTLDALPVAEPQPAAPAAKPDEKPKPAIDLARVWAPFKAITPVNGCAIYPNHRQES